MQEKPTDCNCTVQHAYIMFSQLSIPVAQEKTDKLREYTNFF